ncbi:hypothetical protein BU24DRAFT_419690 [Aaosphaeria arxii CBS 175.79]|uniref:Peptidase S54 rhomboid domain-containing protein n=1 Tax=Aaosphaeria arxii CBS 175.79 TaxID=1450172 RepID=A0A6A5Y4D6_9PLEO|nr:uncharacterized protein BU24DRAFT_419690 [Aaosphaeria arxii CBS 175.79]KAF2020116.1 hypothetical protein BU24DRAFT_419690 [Aaosphaeria arxii CBS 175.79]
MSLLRHLGSTSQRIPLSCRALNVSLNHRAAQRLPRNFLTRYNHHDPRQYGRGTPPPQYNTGAPKPPSQGQLTQDDIRVAADQVSTTYTQQEAINILSRLPQVQVRYLRPFIWAIAVSSGIYVFLAYREAIDSVKPKPWSAPQIQWRRREAIPPQELVANYWKNLDPISKLSHGIIATNAGVHLTSFLVPRYWEMLWHAPALNLNYSLFTSTFVHGGPFHLFFNMWACYNFLLPTGYSKLFEGDPYHTLSFFLSTGILSGYAQHLTTRFQDQAKVLRSGAVPSVWIRSGGASGALFGIFGVFCMQYPDAGVGIVFIPISIAAANFLPMVMAFDLYGMVRGFSSLNLGHAVSRPGT